MPASPSAGLRRASTWLIEVAAVGGAALVLAFVVLQLWRADLRVPFNYSGGDGNFNIMLIKGVIENGWFLHNPDIGFPLGQNLLDYPTSGDNLHFVAFWLLSLGTNDPSVIINVFYTLTYPVTAMTAYVVFRLMGRTRATAGVFALLFTFLPYHLFRGENHVFLSAYQAIPLLCLLLYWAFQPAPLLFDDSQRGIRIVRSRRTLAVVAIALALGAMGVYYGVFAALLLTAAGVVGLVAGWGRHRALSAIAIGALVGVSLVANLSPSIYFRMTNGTNEEVTHDKPEATEWFGLKIGQLVLPVQGHRIDRLAEYQRRSYNPTQPSEGAQQLGAVGAIGFLGLLAWCFVKVVRRDPAAPDDDVTPWAFAAVVSAFVAAIGGFSLVIALAGLTEIRSWNRISLVIAFASYAFVALNIERAVAWLRRRRPGDLRLGVVLAIALPLFLLGALFDQTTSAALPDYDVGKRAYQRDRDVVGAVEAELPAGTAVFQLPYVAFPETPPLYAMTDYDHIRGYIHSRDLKWSYGEVKGRNGNWQSGANALPADQLVPAVLGAGFSAIWVDGAGYPDKGEAKTAEIAEIAGPPFFTSDDGRYRVFDLRAVRDRAARTPGLDRIRAAGEAVLRPVLIEYSAEWSHAEYRDGHTVRSADDEATIELDGRFTRARQITLRLLARSESGTGRLSIATPGDDPTVALGPTLTPVTVRFVLPPGQSVIRFRGSSRFTVADIVADDDAIAAARITAS